LLIYRKDDPKTENPPQGLAYRGLGEYNAKDSNLEPIDYEPIINVKFSKP